MPNSSNLTFIHSRSRRSTHVIEETHESYFTLPHPTATATTGARHRPNAGQRQSYPQPIRALPSIFPPHPVIYTTSAPAPAAPPAASLSTINVAASTSPAAPATSHPTASPTVDATPVPARQEEKPSYRLARQPLLYRPTEHKIHGYGTEKAIGYTSEAPTPIDRPPVELRPSKHATLYVHRHSYGRQVWMYNRYACSHTGERGEASVSMACAAGEGGVWQPVQLGHPHFRLHGYVLDINGCGEAKWVKKTTAQRRAKERKRAEAAGER